MSADYTTTATFAAGAAEVVAVLTTPGRMAGWWTAATGDGRQGGELTVTFGNDDEPLRLRVDVARPGLVQWTCLGYRPVPDWTGTVLRFELAAAAGGGCELTFRHEGLTPKLECFDMCSRSWDHFIPSLQRLVDSGAGDPRGSAADLAWRAARDAAQAAAT
jgi:uncharacterized protein YndB with AHSA1/START domain